MSQLMTFLIKNHHFFCLCYWLIEETNTAEHYERTKFDLYKDDIWLVLTLTYVLMDNFLSLFLSPLLQYDVNFKLLNAQWRVLLATRS